MSEKDDNNQPITKGDLQLLNYKIEVMSSKIEELTRELKNSDERYVLRRDFEQFKKEEFWPLKKILGKVNWLIISTVILALLALVVVGANKLAG